MKYLLFFLLLSTTIELSAQCPINQSNLSFSPNKAIYCPGDNLTITLNTNNPVISMNWAYTGQSTSTNNSGPKVFNILKILTSGNLVISGSTQFGGGTCPVNITMQIKVSPQMLVNAGPDVMIGGVVTQANLGGSPTASGGTAPLSYLWVPALAATANPVASPGTTTNYQLTVTDAAGCTMQDNVTVYQIGSITSNKHYAVLNKTLDGGYYNSVTTGGIKYFYFMFDEEYYAPAGTNITYKIYNDQGVQVSTTPAMAVAIGDNRFALNVNTLTANAFYKVLVYNQKNEVWQARLKIN